MEFNNATITFSGLPTLSSGAPYVAIYDSLTGGTYLGGGTSGQAGALASGSSLVFPVGGFQVMVL